MQALPQVTFRFGSHFDVRYLPEMPQVGDQVTHKGAIWTVTRMDKDATGTVLVCDLPGSPGLARFEKSVRGYLEPT